MIRKNLKVLIITSLVILLPVLVGLCLWNQLPEQIPHHWNAAGEVDGWSSKPMAIIGMPLIMLGLQWLCVLVTRTDPKRAAQSDKILHLVFWLIPLLTIVLFTITYLVALGIQVRVEVVMPVFMGMLFTIIGNYLPKCKQNYTIGIKIPWTLNSEENWNRTHRLSGWVWVGCGLGMVVTGFFGGFWVFFGLLMIMVLTPFLYSYILHRKGI